VARSSRNQEVDDGAPFVESSGKSELPLMKIRPLFCFSVLLSVCTINHAALGASAPAQRVVITPASFSEREGMLVIAHHQGFCRKHNLDAQLVLMPNAPLALSALTAGDSQFY
jgi:hypothetical protein